MRRVVWIELRRTVLGPAAAVLALAQLALMLNDVASWRGVWPMASAAVSAPWLFLGPALAGLSAYDALRRLQRHTRAADVVFAWRSQVTAMLLARVAVVCTVVAVGAVCAAFVTFAAGAPGGFLWPSYLLVTLAFAVGCVAVGMVIGSLGGPLWFAPVVSVLLVFLRAAWFQGASPGSAEAAFTRVFLAGHPWDAVDGRAVLGAVLETVLVVGLALVVPSLVVTARARRAGRVYPRGRAERLVAAGGAMTLLVCGTVAMTSPPVLVERTPPRDPLCSDTHPVVCVWPDNALLLDPLADRARRADALARQVGGRLMDRLDEFGLSRGDSFVAVGRGTWFFSDTLGGALASSLAPLRCDPPQDDPALETYYAAHHDLTALFQLQIEDAERPTGYGDSTGTDAREVERIWRADPAERYAWVADRVATMETVVEGWCA